MLSFDLYRITLHLSISYQLYLFSSRDLYFLGRERDTVDLASEISGLHEGKPRNREILRARLCNPG